MQLGSNLVRHKMIVEVGLQLFQVLVVNARAALTNDRFGLFTLICLLELAAELLLLFLLGSS